MMLLVFCLPHWAPPPPVWCTVSEYLENTTEKHWYTQFKMIFLNESLLEWCIPGAIASPSTEDQLLQEMSVSLRHAFCTHTHTQKNPQHTPIFSVAVLKPQSIGAITRMEGRDRERERDTAGRLSFVLLALYICLSFYFSWFQSCKECYSCREWVMEEWRRSILVCRLPEFNMTVAAVWGACACVGEYAVW